jgi:hypothetical protein
MNQTQNFAQNFLVSMYFLRHHFLWLLYMLFQMSTYSLGIAVHRQRHRLRHHYFFHRPHRQQQLKVERYSQC